MVKVNRQILTRQAGGGRQLETRLVTRTLRPLESGEILVELLMVPIHGSFWLATDPRGVHPRYEEFLSAEEFVFGNGGVGRVIDASPDCRRVRCGDYVSVMGHLPCSHDNCHACQVLQRYTECEFGESMIVGHGKGAPDGTYAEYCILDEIACEVCVGADSQPSEQDLLPFMFAFLLADVRNALTRDVETLQRRRILIIGAGYSGHLAAWLLLRACPEAQIVVADINEDMLCSIARINTRSIHTVALPDPRRNTWADEAKRVLADALRDVFGERKCEVLFDASSGNSTVLWADARVLGPGCHCISFGFGSDSLLLDKACLQVSGLKIMTSRGVGDASNRKASVELISAGAAASIIDYLVSHGRRLDGLDAAIKFVSRQHQSPDAAVRPPIAYIVPNRL